MELGQHHHQQVCSEENNRSMTLHLGIYSRLSKSKHSKLVFFVYETWDKARCLVFSKLRNKDPSKWDLGAGINPQNGYTSIDISYVADIQHNLLQPFEPKYHGTVKSAKFYHGLEHYSRYETQHVLKNIYEVLAPGALLDLRLPDMEYWCKAYLEKGANDNTLGCIFGSLTNDFQVHKNGFNFEYLKRELETAGFAEVKKIPVQEDDPYAHSYPPDSNRLRDLHVTCVKPRKENWKKS
jgi:predicted SAM-dependent methyltransferase